MKILNTGSTRGYNSQTAKKYISETKPIYSLSLELTPQQDFKEGKPTGEIIAYKSWFSQEGLPPFEVKFSKKIGLPSYLSKINFTDLEACEIKNNVYFRSKGLKEGFNG